MTTSSDPWFGRENLRKRVDALVVTAMLGEAASEQLASSLSEIADTAQTIGLEHVAKYARELAQNSDAEQMPERLAALRELFLTSGESRPVSTLAQDPELIADFVVEAREYLSSIESKLLTVEQNGSDAEALNSIFRSFHSIKGLAGFLEMSEIQSVAHEVETLLDLAREDNLAITPDVVDAVLASTDYIIQWLRYLEAAPANPAPANLTDNLEILARLRSLLADAGLPAMERQQEGSVRRDERPKEENTLRSQVVKVDTSKLDHLVDMVGEMVIAQTMVRHDPDLRAATKPRLARNLSQLARITGEVQRTAMSMRMVPIGPLFQKMARLVRDLTRKCGKEAELETEGSEVELDRNIVEQLADPLMHMVRNSIDHGIETPGERIAEGKRPAGRIRLRALHQAGLIVIEIGDDGRGLNREKILARALRNQLIAEGANLTSDECTNLIFQPGFSTAEEVSDISGRGVGMDVVRRHVQKLRGNVKAQSIPGKGTTFRLEVPLTLAIIDGLVVAVGEERYIIPIFSVRELVQGKEGMVSRIENRAEVVIVRERVLPVVRLHQRFGIRPASEKDEDSVLIVAESDGRLFCMMVDRVIGKQEVVMKSLGRLFQNVRGVAGGAILGDGQVGLILDVNGMYGRAADAA